MNPGKGVPARHSRSGDGGPKNQMFTAVIIILILFALARVRAAEVTLTWDPNPDTTAGYLLYYGVAEYTNSIDCGKRLTNTVTGLATNVPYRFALTAYNPAGLESDFSPELSVTLPLPPPRTNPPPMVQITTILETTTYGLFWFPVTQWSTTVPATNATQLFRARSSITQTN